MNQNNNDADSGASLSDAELGRIAYEAAAAETGCTQPWVEANQAKWIAGAKAVAKAEREACAGICDRFAERQMHPAECAGAIRMRSNI